MKEMPVVAQVMMPEKGLFLVRCTCEPPRYGAQVLVSLDYGQDLGMVTESGEYDPDRHGSRLPGFQLLRLIFSRPPEIQAGLSDCHCLFCLQKPFDSIDLVPPTLIHACGMKSKSDVYTVPVRGCKTQHPFPCGTVYVRENQ